jgi:hypothetical protein
MSWVLKSKKFKLIFRVAKLGTKNQLERDAIFVLTDCALQAQQRLNQQMIWNFSSRIFFIKISSSVAQNFNSL